MSKKVDQPLSVDPLVALQAQLDQIAAQLAAIVPQEARPQEAKPQDAKPQDAKPQEARRGPGRPRNSKPELQPVQESVNHATWKDALRRKITSRYGEGLSIRFVADKKKLSNYIAADVTEALKTGKGDRFAYLLKESLGFGTGMQYYTTSFGFLPPTRNGRVKFYDKAGYAHTTYWGCFNGGNRPAGAWLIVDHTTIAPDTEEDVESYLHPDMIVVTLSSEDEIRSLGANTDKVHGKIKSLLSSASDVQWPDEDIIL